MIHVPSKKQIFHLGLYKNGNLVNDIPLIYRWDGWTTRIWFILLFHDYIRLSIIICISNFE